MKHHLIAGLIALMLLPLTAGAQRKLVIYYDGKPVNEVAIWDVDSVVFTAADPVRLPDDAAMPKAIDLGLSVPWADVNLGAAGEADAGLLVGWGDVTGLNRSVNPKWYPVENPNSDITDTGNDIVKQAWATEADRWRLPSGDEIQELVDNCTWEWTTRDGIAGYEVTGPSGNSIFLPAAGCREGNQDPTGAGTSICYWSGALNPADNGTALAMTGSETEKPAVTSLRRYLGCALRAVCGEPKINVTIEATAITDKRGMAGKTSAKIEIALKGAYNAYSSLEYGVLFSTNNDLKAEVGVQKVSSTTPVGADGTNVLTLDGLVPDAVYYYLPYLIVNGKTVYGQEGKVFYTTSFPEPKIVDMGLSVKWASFNVGATSPEEAGNYIGWGDATGTLTSQSASDYAKGNTSAYIGGNKDYDVAQAKWGDKWRMPKRSEFEELLNPTLCTAYENTINMTWTFTSIKTGESIILPMGGLVNDTHHVDKTSWAWYWTAEADESDRLPYMLMIYGKNMYSFDKASKAFRTPIRAVYEEDSDHTPPGGGDTPSTPGEDEDDPVTPPTDPETPVAGAAVDLGLSVKWADRNIGSTTSNLVGEYIAWGDTAQHLPMTPANYVHTDSTGTNGYRYIGNTISGTEYDAAHVRWAGTWRMPTHAEINELRDNCTWTWTTRGGVDGYEVKGPSGKSIFLPASGYMLGNNVQYSTCGFYWADELDSRIPQRNNMRAEILYFENSNIKIDYYDRYYGFPIRPVQPK